MLNLRQRRSRNWFSEYFITSSCVEQRPIYWGVCVSIRDGLSERPGTRAYLADSSNKATYERGAGPREGGTPAQVQPISPHHNSFPRPMERPHSSLSTRIKQSCHPGTLYAYVGFTCARVKLRFMRSWSPEYGGCGPWRNGYAQVDDCLCSVISSLAAYKLPWAKIYWSLMLIYASFTLDGSAGSVLTVTSLAFIFFQLLRGSWWETFET